MVYKPSSQLDYVFSYFLTKKKSSPKIFALLNMHWYTKILSFLLLYVSFSWSPFDLVVLVIDFSLPLLWTCLCPKDVSGHYCTFPNTLWELCMGHCSWGRSSLSHLNQFAFLHFAYNSKSILPTQFLFFLFSLPLRIYLPLKNIFSPLTECANLKNCIWRWSRI